MTQNVISSGERVPCALEKNVHFVALGRNALNTSVKSHLVQCVIQSPCVLVDLLLR